MMQQDSGARLEELMWFNQESSSSGLGLSGVRPTASSDAASLQGFDVASEAGAPKTLNLNVYWLLNTKAGETSFSKKIVNISCFFHV